MYVEIASPPATRKQKQELCISQLPNSSFVMVRLYFSFEHLLQEIREGNHAAHYTALSKELRERARNSPKSSLFRLPPGPSILEDESLANIMLGKKNQRHVTRLAMTSGVKWAAETMKRILLTYSESEPTVSFLDVVRQEGNTGRVPTNATFYTFDDIRNADDCISFCITDATDRSVPYSTAWNYWKKVKNIHCHLGVSIVDAIERLAYPCNAVAYPEHYEYMRTTD